MARVRLTDRYVGAISAPQGRRLEIFDQHPQGAGLMLRVADTGRKIWMVRYRTYDGQQRRLNLGSYPDVGLSEARGRAAAARVEAADGGDPAGARKQRRVEAKTELLKTFNNLADAYFTACEVGEWKPRGKKKRASTLANEKWLWSKHIKPHLGELTLEQVSPAAIKQILRNLVAAGRESTSNKVRAQIRQMFNFAIGDERIAVNPVSKTVALGDEAPRQRVLSDQEIRVVWSALSSRSGLLRKGGGEVGGGRVFIGEPVSIALKLLLVTLVRRSEMTGVARRELDLDNGTWLIPGDRTKSGRSHLVPLTVTAIALFRRAIEIANAGRSETSPYVFPCPRDRSRPITPAALTHSLRYVREALDLERLTPHDLRRTAATIMASERLEISPFLIGKVLSHSTETGGAANVTLTTYALYDYVKEKRSALLAWEALLNKIVQSPSETATSPMEVEPAVVLDDDMRRLIADPRYRQALIAELLGQDAP
jgi:integrase